MTKLVKVSRFVRLRMKVWKILREKPQDLINLIFLIKVLNAVWKAHNRNQKSKSAMVWLLAEQESQPLKPSRFMQKAEIACNLAKSLVKQLGYEATPRYVFEKYIGPRGIPVTTLALFVSHTDKGKIKQLKERLWAEQKNLPREGRRKAWKKKKRRKKK